MSGQLVGRVGPRDQGSSLERPSSSQVGKPDLHPGPSVPDSHSFSGLLGRTRSRFQPAVLESPRRGGGWSLPPCLGLVTLSLLVQLFHLGQDVSNLPLCHLQDNRDKRQEGEPPINRVAALTPDPQTKLRAFPGVCAVSGAHFPSDRPTTPGHVPRKGDELSGDRLRNKQ